MIDLSITHRPRNQMVFDKLGNISGYVESPDYPMGLIEKNSNLGTKNWGKGIGGKAEEIDAELHAKIAKLQYLNPKQNISNWNSLFKEQQDQIINELSEQFGSTKGEI